MPLELLSEPDWLERRRQHVTASDAARVFTERGGPLTLWAEKTGKEEPEFPALLADFGHAVEEISRKWFQKDLDAKAAGLVATGRDIGGIAFISRGVLGASQDTLLFLRGATFDKRETIGRIVNFCEHKSCDRVVAWKWANGPDRYCWLQCQATLAVMRAMKEAGEPVGWDASGAYATVLVGNGYNPDKDFRVYEIEADEDWIGEIRGWAEHFWVSHVQADIPPPPDGLEATLKTLRTLWPPRLRTEETRTGVLPASAWSWYDEWRSCKATIDQLSRRMAKAKQELEAAMGGAELDEASIAIDEAHAAAPRLVRRSYERAGYEVGPTTVNEFRELK
jgi:predicted phage-related endonuclease